MKEINKELASFYSDLLGTKLPNNYPPTAFDENLNEFIQNLEIPKLSPKESTPLESELSIDEVNIVLNSFRNNKSPGHDGFSKEFYETFFDIIGTHLLNSYNVTKPFVKVNSQYPKGEESFV